MKYGIVFFSGSGISGLEGIISLDSLRAAYKDGDYRHSDYRVSIIGELSETEKVLSDCYDSETIDELYKYPIHFISSL